ncbi:galacturonosyltransferase 15 isoform X1 [Tripterygium wilfordii]|uniref:Hexosyltransferase n=1 Tax=Tripterygium wilfordii TaxID=458696 RepID=A0A7J7C990_TRIWF|nr:probable galacturonosyltransferase 15 [Tripterygium wilfordii]KAF5730703.1 galacturonosyltransferase 15 isoform X1 [Tripterygium wilfordii]
MNLYISAKGIKRLEVPSSKVAPFRRVISRRTLTVVLLLGIFLPFLFVRIAFSVLESASACSSSIDCIGWRLRTSLKLREELTRALLEANNDSINGGGEGMDTISSSFDSFNQLVHDMTSKQQDIKDFVSKTKSMLSRMELKVQSARQRESIHWHLASHGIPKSLHCLSLKLAEEYAVNAMARSHLPPPEYVSRIADPLFMHVVLLTDNVLAASVVISSTVQNSVDPERLVFHIVTDKKTYTPMHAWFAINPIQSAVVEVKGLHQYDWTQEVNVGVKEMLEIHRLIWTHHYKKLKQEFHYEGEAQMRKLEALSPSGLSLMNHLRLYIPQLFPDLNKIVFLDDDVVVQHDISSLWELELNKKVVGAVVGSWCGENSCSGRRYVDYLNFSHPIIFSTFDPDRCAWLYGMNVFDLKAWRRTNITSTYRKWLKHNLNSGLELWQPGMLPPALLAFEGYVLPIDPSYHMAGLGYRSTQEAPKEIMEASAVLHFTGPAKPWLEIGFPEVRNFWSRYVNCSNKFIRKCKIVV